MNHVKRHHNWNIADPVAGSNQSRKEGIGLRHVRHLLGRILKRRFLHSPKGTYELVRGDWPVNTRSTYFTSETIEVKGTAKSSNELTRQRFAALLAYPYRRGLPS